MKTTRRCLVAYVQSLLVLALLVLQSTVFAQDKGLPYSIRIETEEGTIIAELYPDKAPATAANFLRYVDSGSFNGGCFMRTVRPDNEQNPVKIQVIQAVVHPWKENSSFPPIALERTSITGLRHTDGVISMARSEPNSATSSFFICIGDQPELDIGGKRNPDGQGFAAFGRVTQGMDIVRRIQMSPAEGQALVPLVRISSIVRLAGEKSNPPR
ncbi:MAG: peptidylprolyl isomerase [Ignavibacteriales bacterium]|nr:peptidylprolyl isomerase [Ignavibacteriales bacterium]